MQERKPPTIKRNLADRFGEVLDQVVFAFRPVAGAKRMDFRRRYKAVSMSAHEGATIDETRGSSWIGSRLSPDAAMEEDRAELISRSKELYRNDSIGGAIDSRVNLVVSYGFTPQAAIQPREGITQDQADTWNDQIELVYDQVYTRIGRTGKDNLWQETRLALRCYDVYGEGLVILSDVGGNEKPIPLTIEVVDPERLETPIDKISNPRIRMGIEYDAQGRITHYYIRRTHPGDTKHFNFEYDRIEASRVLHIFERWFPGQSRGYPWMTRILNRIKDAKDLGEATIIAAQVEACYAAFVKGGNPYDAATANSAGTTTAGNRFQEVRPGGIHYLNTGEEVTFGSPSRPGNTFAPFMDWNGRKEAAGLNWSFEMLAKDWRGMSFAGGRLTLAEQRMVVESLQKLLVERMLTPIWNRMVEEAVIVGAVDIPPRLYQRMPWVFQAHEWGPPAWPFALTPREEVESTVTAIENNLMTKKRAVSRLGGWLSEVFKQRAIERDEERTLGIQPGSAQEEVKAEAMAQPAEPMDGQQQMAAEEAAA